MPIVRMWITWKKTRINLRQSRKAKQRGTTGKGTFPHKVPPKLFQTKCSVFPNYSYVLYNSHKCSLKNMVFITAIKKWKCNQVKLWSLECTPFWSVAHTSGKKSQTTTYYFNQRYNIYDYIWTEFRLHDFV